MSTPPQSPARRALARLGLVLGGLLLGMLLAELLARVVAPAGHADLLFNAPDTTPEGLYRIQHELMIEPVPGFQATAQGLGRAVPLRIDAQGLRGADLGEKRGRRWLAIGDSFTLSTQVPEEETFQAHLAAATGAQVGNAGVDGYSTWQAASRYARLDPAVQADGALLTFFLGNDLQDNERFPAMLPEARRLPEGSPIPRPATSATERWLTRHSFLYAHWRVRARAQALASGQDPVLHQWRDELSIFTTAGSGRLRQLGEATRRALRALRQAVGTDEVLVAIAPPAFAVQTERVAPTFEVVGLDPAGADLEAPARLVAEVARQEGLPTCDLGPALRAGAAEAPMYLTYDGHWTPQGHAVVAEALRACRSAW